MFPHIFSILPLAVEHHRSKGVLGTGCESHMCLAATSVSAWLHFSQATITIYIDGYVMVLWPTALLD